MAGQKLSLGVLMISGGALCIPIMAGIMKWTSQAFSVEFLIFLRMALGLVLFMLLWICQRPRIPLATSRPWQQLAYACCCLGGAYCLYLSLKTTRLPDAILLLNLAPMLAVMWNWLFMRKTETPRVWLGMCVGFAGVALVMLPGLSGLARVPWLALSAGVFLSLAIWLNSVLVTTEPKERTSFYMLLFGLGISVAGVALVGVKLPAWQHSLFPHRDWVDPLFEDLGLGSAVLALGIITVLVPLLNSGAYRYGSVGQLGSFRYLQVIFAGFIDWVVWGQVPGWNSVAGFLLVAGGGVLVVYRPKAAARAAPTGRRGLAAFVLAHDGLEHGLGLNPKSAEGKNG